MKNLIKKIEKMRELKKLNREYISRMNLLGFNETNIKIINNIHDAKLREFVGKYY